MKGFLKRDWLLLRVALPFYILFILFVSLLGVVGKMSLSFCNTYLIMFSAMCIMNLFSYDDANHWTGYAAAMPSGRQTMVDARYVLTFCICLVIMAMQFIFGWPDIPVPVSRCPASSPAIQR